MLPPPQGNELLAHICKYTRSYTNFLLRDCDLHIKVIPGETEGLYGWIAANYLLGGFDNPDEHVHGKGHHTYGFLDMGGASAQIAFAPNATEAEKHAEDLKLLRMRTVNGAKTEYKVFTTTWLGYGVHEARRRHVQALIESTVATGLSELPDPCLPVGLKLTAEGDILSFGLGTSDGKKPHFIGTGRFDECLRQTYTLLDKDAPCADPPCLLHGVHVPAIDFDVNHFVGVSEYWHTTHEVFEMAHKDKAYDFNSYQNQVRDFCNQDWKDIQKGVKDKVWGKKVDEATAVDVCFKASWMINVLHNGIGIPRVGLEDTQGNGHNGTKEVLQGAKKVGFTEPFQAVDEIDSTEVSWTLGKMVLYAASEIPPRDDRLPVGFGSNVAGTPPDFQYAGGEQHSPSVNTTHEHEPKPHGDEDDSWSDTLFEKSSSRRVPGFILFILIVCIATFLLCGRDRRSRFFRKFSPFQLLRRNRGGRTPRGTRGKVTSYFSKGAQWSHHTDGTHDHLLESGPNPYSDFELDEVDSHSSENDYSDDSSGSKTGKTSGWATPALSTPKEHSSLGQRGEWTTENLISQGVGLGLVATNAMDRSGLFPRNESRERLSGGNLGAEGTQGRKSRRGSPTRERFRSPLMSPLKEF